MKTKAHTRSKSIRYSFIIPVHNGLSTLPEVLDAVFALGDPDVEVIVFDDASTDGTGELLKKYPCLVIRSEVKLGPAAGRNRSARTATGEILIFVDSDVLIPPDTLRLVEKTISADNADALIGVYGLQIRYADFASNFKNSYQYFTYGFLPRLKNVPNFCSSLAAIKKTVFIDVGGYDEHYTYPLVEDSEFGERISEKYKLFSCRDLVFEHMKHYTCAQVLQTDFKRAGAVIKIMLRKRFHEKGVSRPRASANIHSSLQKSYIFGILLTAAALLSIPCGFIFHPGFFAASGFLFIAIMFLNRKFIGLVGESLRGRRRLPVFVKTCLFLFVDLVTMGLGIFCNIFGYLAGRRY